MMFAVYGVLVLAPASRGRNQLCQILSQSGRGFRFCGGRILAFP